MSIEITGAVKRFGASAAVDGVSVDIPAGAFFVVLGPSGCGKSTLLRLIAGLETLDAGRIALSGAVVAAAHSAGAAATHAPPEARGVGVVFQSYALWPHMNVLDNVAFPLEAGGASRPGAREAARSHLRTVALDAFAERSPAALSGGQRQRVALARCLAGGARVILMDEPLANLDPHLRAAMEVELSAFHRDSGATTLYITHDQREAMALADQVAVMNQGRFEQVGRPEDVYERPRTAHVARFIGRGALIEADLSPAPDAADGARRMTAALGGAHWPVAADAEARPGRATVLLRPNHLEIDSAAADSAPPAAAVAAIVTEAAYRGGVWEAMVALKDAAGGTLTPVPAAVSSPRRLTPGETLTLRLTGGWSAPGLSEAAATGGDAGSGAGGT